MISFNNNKGHQLYILLLMIAIASAALLAPGLRPNSLHVAPESLKAAWSVAGIAIILTLWVLSHWKNEKVTVRKTSFYYPVAGFLLWCSASIIWSVDDYSAFLQLIKFYSVAIAFFIVVNSFHDNNEIKQLLWFIVLGSVLVAVMGFLQLFFKDNEEVTSLVRYHSQVASTFGNKNMASHFMVMTIPFSLVFLVKAQKGFSSIIFAAVLVVLISYLFLSYTRTGILALTVELVFFTLFLLYDRNNREKGLSVQRPLFVIVATLLVGLIASIVAVYYQQGLLRYLFIFLSFIIFILLRKMSARRYCDKKYLIFFVIFLTLFGSYSYISSVDNSYTSAIKSRLKVLQWKVVHIKVQNNSRLPAWKNTLEIIKEYPYRGIGVGQWSVEYPLYYDRVAEDTIFNEKVRLRHLHNDYLEMLANVGIIGASFLLWLFFLTVRAAYKTLSDPKNEGRYLTLALVLGLVGFAVSSMFSFPVKVYYPMLLAMVYIGLIGNIYFRNIHSLDIFSESTLVQKAGNNAYKTQYNVLSKIRTKILLFISIVLVVAASTISYKWLMGEHYFNLVQGIERAKYDDPSEKSLIKLQTIEKSIISNPYDPKAQFVAGNVLMENKYFDEGIEYLEKSLKGSPYQTSTLRSLFFAYGSKNDAKNMQRIIEKYMEVDPRSVRAHAYATSVYMKLGRVGDAKRVYQQMKENYSYFKGRKGFGPYYSEVAGVAQAVGDIEYAKDIFLEAIEKSPKDATYCKMLGGLYFLYPKNKEEKKKGIGLLKRALNLNPKMVGSEEVKQLIKKYVDDVATPII